MTMQTFDQPSTSVWLKTYYFVRAAFSIAWVGAAFSVGLSMPAVAAVLLVVYPAWDAVANFVDARRSGGLQANPAQALNVAVSTLATAAMAVAVGIGMHAALGVFGAWAALAGLLQLAAGVRRWKSQGAQWAMILSGAQSTLAGALFLYRATGPATPGIGDMAPYAAVGAFYFLVSACWLAVSDARRRRNRTA